MKTKTVLVLLLFVAITTLSNAQYIMTHQATTLSIGLKNKFEAVAVSSTCIEIYFSKANHEFLVSRDGTSITNVRPGTRKIVDSGLAPDTVYTYGIGSNGNTTEIVTEKTFPVFQPAATYDVVVIGATASGTAAAVAAARFGASVALIEETNRAGGMASNGVSVTDLRNIEHSNGFFEEFRSSVVDYYGGGSGLCYEPRVANAIMKSMIYAEPGISFFRNVRAVAALRQGPRIAGVAIEDLKTGETGQLFGQVVIDATAEADIAASAGVSFRIPREARSNAEPHAGQIYYDNQTDEIQPGSTGAADNRVQSYAYLLTVKDYGSDVDLTGPPPPNYNPEDYRYSPPWTESWAYQYGRLPDGKYELNEHPWGGDLPGVNYNYPNAEPVEREQIADLYRWRALGYLHYLQTELGLKSLGLADDEYPDNCSFPPTLYVREARRMIGRSTMDESDVTFNQNRCPLTSIAIGDYPMDSHATKPVEGPCVKDRGEGEWWLVNYTPWYRIPLGIIVPEDMPGLLVSTAVSATHVAYGTLRMEPVRMSIGQAAGTLAALSVRFGVYPTEVPSVVVQDRLLEQKAYITWFSDVDKATRHLRAIQFLAIRGFFQGESFRPDEYLSREEAAWLMKRLVDVEKCGPDCRIHPPPPAGGAPITRAEFAAMLVSAKGQIDIDWTPTVVQFSHYLDLMPSTPVSQAAETLFRHRIDPLSWAGPPPISAEGMFFYPDAPIMRADAAQAIWLADRTSALSFPLR